MAQTRLKPTAGSASAQGAAPAPVITPPFRRSPVWAVAARVNGQPAAWVAARSGVTLMRLNQDLVRVDLHAGSSDGGVGGWSYGDQVDNSEIHHLIAAFNGGFKLTYANVGFVANGHMAVPLKAGLASIVTYTDGSTEIGAWHVDVPAPGKQVFSVLQNQRLLVSGGRAASDVSGCVTVCWGGTIGLATVVPRSALGVNAQGELIWAAGLSLSPAGLARALIDAGAVRAIKLDINPDWVAGYLYVHHPGGPSPVELLPGQHGIAGELLAPYTRDFFAVVAR